MKRNFKNNCTLLRKLETLEDSLDSCDDKTNHCNLYLSNSLLSGQSRGKLSIDDESSHPINGSSTNNKSERKRNSNMKDVGAGVGCGSEGENDMRDNTKRMKLDGITDGQDDNKSKMYQIYQPWVLSTYGDLSRSKTITLKKQSRIVSALNGLETSRPDSSKFRFWVKSKGFMMDLPSAFQHLKPNQIDDDGCFLFIPSKLDAKFGSGFKRVAVVEYFFDIIYKVHCSVEGGGRHVGQKRTYRKITECYAFLPREAVTKFLTQCNVCRKNMKSAIISEIDQRNNEVEASRNLKSQFENSFPCNRNKHVKEQLSEVKKEKEKNITYEINGNTNDEPNQHSTKNFNSDIKHESNNSPKRKIPELNVRGEKSLGNIIINSLDFLINSNYRNINKLRISCHATPDNVSSISPKSPQQQVTSSTPYFKRQDSKNFSLIKCSERHNSSFQCKESLVLTGSNSTKVSDATSYADKRMYGCLDVPTTSTTCSNNSKSHPNSEDDVKDYLHPTKGILPIEGNCNENISSGDIEAITSTYLLMTRSMGLADEDALDIDLVSVISKMC